MKAINIASGVAVTALALAISAQANAAAHGGDTETTFSYTGSMEAVVIVDMVGTDANGDEATVVDVDLDEGDDFDSATAGEAWGLEMEVGVVHGPFSGSVGVRTNDGEVEAFAGDIVITDGPISFGQVGSVISTHDYAYDMGDSKTGLSGRETETVEIWNDDGDGVIEDGEVTSEVILGDKTTLAEGLDEGAPVGAGIRYTMGGLKVQIEGRNDEGTDYGLGVAYEGSADAISYVADANLRVSDQSPDDADAYMYVGAGVTYTADLFTAKAGFNTYNTPTTTAQLQSGEKESFSEYGFELTVTPMENASAYVKGMDIDAGNDTDSMQLLFGANYTIDMIGLTAEYTYTAAEEAGDELFAEVTYTQDKISAYADLTLAELDAETSEAPQIGAGVAYTQDNGVKYAADFDFQAEGDEVNNVPVNDAENKLKLSASYAF